MTNISAINKTRQFFREVYVELRKVNWLSHREVLKYTLIVLAASFIVAALLGGLDFLFSLLIREFILE